MKLIPILVSTAILMATSHANADVDLTFDGVSTGGWTLVNASSNFTPHVNLVPFDSLNGEAMRGIRFEDGTTGAAYYSAPASFLANDFTGMSLTFDYQIVGANFTTPINGFEDLYVNGTPLVGYDVIDHEITDAIQSVTIDFTDAAFSGVDLSNVSSLYVRAEWWIDNNNGGLTESYLIDVPEPHSTNLLMTGLLMAMGCIRHLRS